MSAQNAYSSAAALVMSSPCGGRWTLIQRRAAHADELDAVAVLPGAQDRRDGRGRPRGALPADSSRHVSAARGTATSASATISSGANVGSAPVAAPPKPGIFAVASPASTQQALGVRGRE